jgi:ketosteroid isomerase-like protein
MSQENVEVVRRVYEAVNSRLGQPRELFDPDYEVDARDVSAEFRDVIWGFDAADEALREYWQTFDDFHVEMEELVHVDERRVVNTIRDDARIRGSDAQVSGHYFHVWTFDDERIVGLSIHTDRSRALEAAGLRE